ncbi:LysR family transcriptional regulator [Alloyangia pacifica]|uniref:DNA-binding transcriptional regulator, LysR family n=1 Tax=Alloyangia pacifica TaxID=311180 RepID=A0A1I6NXB9_9RHOB|nr:LysR family transcriptional regulator [Alloyangia pacifica]SDH58030.1 DNA-binding transcriptional regulator, LysR family [Alloyangia pacifica]SFS32488.1 DNA-binding transcriptional regulator, LysR family [Alloyangia pacifica]
MKTTPSLDDIALFLAVADAGTLAGAAKRSGASQPTLSRRMTELERQLGQQLFQRGAQRYGLTAEGRQLAEEMRGLREVSARLGRWQQGTAGPVRVRITAGLWTSRFLARGLAHVWSPEAPWLPEFTASNADLDIARRAADIGVRNRRPEQPWLAGRRTRRLAYAAYGRDAQVQGYVTLPPGAATTPSERWLRETHPDEIVTHASDARLALDMALAGVARIVMPCFAGDTEPGLLRLSDPIETLCHDEWLVAHHEARHDPPVRAALDACHALLTAPDRAGTSA